MTRRRINARAIVRGLATVIVIAAAAVVWHYLPVATQVFAPFDVHGTSGRVISGRAISATVHGARVTSDVIERSTSLTDTRVRAIGRWVVVDATVQAERDSVVPKAELMVGGNTYNPADRFLLYNLGALLDPGIPARGAWIFDVAANLLDDASTSMIVRIWAGDGRLDSRLVIDVDKRDISTQNEVKLVRPVVGR